MKTEKEVLIDEINEKLDELFFYGEHTVVEVIREILFPLYCAERSKREDSSKDEMRCSEHGGNIVREVQ